MPPLARRYSLLDLVRAYLDLRRWRDAHEDLRTHYGARYRALARAFDVEVEQVLAQAADPRELDPEERHLERHALAAIAQDAVRQYEQTSTPFAGCLAAPRIVANVCGPHEKVLSALADATSEALVLLVRDVVAALVPDAAGASVDGARLRELGFDDERAAPDPLDYF